MLVKNGNSLLMDFADSEFHKAVHQINNNVWHLVSWGHSNATVIEGNTSLILIDTLDSDQRARRMREYFEQKLKKPFKTIIYTHGHPDHRGGSGAFRDCNAEIIAFAPERPAMEHYDKLSDILSKRTVRQFGYKLTESELLWQGVGIREGHASQDGRYDFLAPTTVYKEKIVKRIIDGVELHLQASPGECEDGLFVWLAQDKIVCCGDSYYGCWPNLYAIRGSQYRDIALWISSLKEIKKLNADVLLAGHTQPVIGNKRVFSTLENYIGAIESILIQTLYCMNKGMSESETVETVRLPEKYSSLSYLGEFYGTVQWSVRAIYNGYLGWFDGNPTNLNRLSDKEYCSELIELIEIPKIKSRIEKALEDKRYQLVLQLCDLMLNAYTDTDFALKMKQKALLEIAELETSANGRHYYIACAKEMNSNK